MSSEKRKFGDKGEEVAVNYLKKQGYKILDRNWAKHGYGEIDIVAAKAAFLGKIKELVFVEVKTIQGASRGSAALAAQNVHFEKQRRLIKTAQSYLAAKKIPEKIPWRIDVIAVAMDEKSGLLKIEHLENAVWER